MCEHSRDMSAYDYNVKVILLGDFGVGKSTLLNYLSQQKDSEIVCCCAQSNKNAFLELEINRDGKRILVRLTDTGGQERYRSITSSYYRGTHGCIIMYDVSREDSFHNIQNWNDDLETYGPTYNVSTMIVGNKCLSKERVVTRQRGEKHAEHLDLPYMEIDVHNEVNIAKLFTNLVDNIMEHNSRKSSLIIDESILSHRKLTNETPKPSFSCCAC